MSEDHIERDTLIAAPLDQVWSLVAEPGFWVSQEGSRRSTRLPMWHTAGPARFPVRNCARATAPSWNSR
jgi:hypothetical protein